MLTVRCRANGYQAEESETWLGEWMTKTGRRDELVLATKYTSGYKNFTEPERIQANYGGSSAKSLHLSVEASLKKLQTSYIDLVPPHTIFVALLILCCGILLIMVFPPSALCPLLGYAYVHHRSNAIPQLPRLFSQSALPWHI